MKASTNNRMPYICCNCGGEGHMYRQCNQPITSFGCIAYRLVYDAETNSVGPEYLMVQRRDSLAYVEFIRGKYKLENLTYICKLLGNMTKEELACLRDYTFSELWTRLWTYGSTKCYQKEQSESEIKMNKLKEGYFLLDRDSCLRRISLNDLIDDTPTSLEETEWGFPKGRRNLMESDKNCATREFREETGIKINRLRIRFEKPVDEIFTGSNHVRYKHVYYIAEYMPMRNERFVRGASDATSTTEDSAAGASGYQLSEIKSVRWFTYAKAQDKLKCSNIEKRELLKRVNNLILRHASRF